jgi:hypothetical protein
MTELHELSALEAAAAVRGKAVSPVELVEHALERIERLDGRLASFVTVTADAALDQARDAERAVLAADDPAGLPPLLGVPTAVKDLNLTAGVPTKFGSRAFDDFVPAFDDHVVTLLRAAGTISLGKTATPELGLHRDRPRPGHPQPVGPEPHAGRLERGCRRRDGRGPGAVRPGQRRRRLHPHPGQCLWPGGSEDLARAGVEGAAGRRRLAAGGARAAGAHGARCRRFPRRRGRRPAR